MKGLVAVDAKVERLVAVDAKVGGLLAVDAKVKRTSSSCANAV